MNISFPFRLLVLLCGALIFGGVSAQDSSAPLYDVELIIFRNLGSKPTPEDWSIEESLANRGRTFTGEESADAQNRLTDGLSIQTLSNEQLKLGALAASLRGNRNYRVLSHIGWTQSPVALRSDSITLLAPLLAGDSTISGSAKLSRGTTLHLSLDLRLKNEAGGNYVLQETRQIKLGEKHYFDHPYFGVIATVTAHR